MPTKKGGYRLPEIVNPERRCITLRLPFDDAHIEAFLGQIYELSYWNNWQRDTDKMGTLVAAVWKEIYFEAALAAEQMGVCEMAFDIRQKPDDPCIIQKTIDGVTWLDAVDMSLCVPDIPVYRVDGSGNLQSSSDGGVTWDDVQKGPVRIGSNPQSPPLARSEDDSDARKCAASINAARVLRDTYTSIGTELASETASQIGVLGAAQAILFAFIDFTYSLIQWSSLIGTIFVSQTVIVNNPITDDDEKDMICILLSHATDTDGVITFDYSAVQSDFVSHGGSLSALVLIMPFLGGDGLNIAGSVNYTSVDDANCNCDACSVVETMAGSKPSDVYFAGEGPRGADEFQTGGQWISEDGGTLESTYNADAYHRNQFWAYLDLGQDCPYHSFSVDVRTKPGVPDWAFNITVGMKNESGANEGFASGDNGNWPAWHTFTFAGGTDGMMVRYIFISMNDNTGNNAHYMQTRNWKFNA